MDNSFAGIHDVEQKLQELFRRHGAPILEQPERVEGWLRYACADNRRETNVLLGALRLRIPQGLLANENKELLSERLTGELTMTEEASIWAVEAWAKALTHADNAAGAQAIQERPRSPISTMTPPSQHPYIEDEQHSPQRLADSVQTRSVAKTAADWVREVRLLKLLEMIQTAYENDPAERKRGVSVLLVLCGFLALTIGIGLIIASQTGPGAIVSCAAFVSIWIGHQLYADYSEKNKRIDETVKTLAREFPGEIREWGDEPALRNCETVSFLIRTQRAKIAQADPHAVQPHLGHMILALGIAGVVLPLLAPFAWAFGHQDLRAMAKGEMDRSGESMTTSGRTFGVILTCVYGVLAIAVLASRA